MACPPHDKGKAPPRGARYEAYAERWLGERGLQPVARNFRARVGEIDLVMKDGQTLVFIEVRYRRSARFGGAAASIDSRKQARLIRTAEAFLKQHRRYVDVPCRFDVIAMTGEAPTFELDWISGAFSA